MALTKVSIALFVLLYDVALLIILLAIITLVTDQTAYAVMKRNFKGIQ